MFVFGKDVDITSNFKFTCGPSISALLLTLKWNVASPADPLPLAGAGIEIFWKKAENHWLERN